MSGQPWQDVCNAFRLFLQRRVREQATSDLVSVIQFDNNARIAMQGVSIREDLELLRNRRGGTKFIPPLTVAQRIVSNSQTAHIPVLVFMSDGAGGDSHGCVLNKMRELIQYCPSLSVHTIGFRRGAPHVRLQVRSTSTWCRIVDDSTVVRKWQLRLGDSITRPSQESICQMSF